MRNSPFLIRFAHDDLPTSAQENRERRISRRRNLRDGSAREPTAASPTMTMRTGSKEVGCGGAPNAAPVADVNERDGAGFGSKDPRMYENGKPKRKNEK